eukprot:SAG11_NODE_13275_length_662_cov_0.902309_1_plen_53_part_01
MASRTRKRLILSLRGEQPISLLVRSDPTSRIPGEITTEAKAMLSFSDCSHLLP